MLRITTGADGDQRQQAGFAFGVRPHRSRQKAAHLSQRIAEDVGQPVAVVDQPLDGVEPDAFGASS